MSGLPHAAGRIVPSGAPLATARLGVVLAHGRGGSPDDMTRLGAVLGIADATFLALEADGGSWFPQSFLAPLAANAQHLEGALAAIDRAVAQLNAVGIPDRRIGVMGFSQGACLSLEYAARARRPLKFACGLSGALIGTGEAGGEHRADLHGNREKTFAYEGLMNGTRIYLACHESDPHIPLSRVQDSARLFRRRGASVTVEVIPGAGHGIVPEEVDFVREIMRG